MEEKVMLAVCGVGAFFGAIGSLNPDPAKAMFCMAAVGLSAIMALAIYTAGRINER